MNDATDDTEGKLELGRSTVQLVERRKSDRKRVSATTAELRGRDKVTKRVRGSVTIDNLSENGARIIGPTHSEIEVGTSIQVKLANAVGTVVVRHIAADPLEADQSIYGVELSDTDAALSEAIRARIDEEETVMEWIWANT